ncbi:hypothetical protein SAMN04488550_0593 [Gordonia malaquae]|uniref:Uncharacterized protein n=1 Tax=Gordonia malaquae NBRC 108250 TaxID=1223542 RepID=M3UM36_GORML|nr:hypothetical protein [Gordonia malaquae]GAC80845.1 hypothetical protein GM1_023_00040 [Gordonia malaquae NBRC 108250]SEB67257.1 hypothetical protein SAMN04488550_0593 [Gordonia malaquae]
MSRDNGKRPLWTRRWVLLALTAAVLFGSGYAVGASGDRGTRPAPAPTVEQVRP